MNRCAGAVLWTAVAVQAIWVALNSLILHLSPGPGVLGMTTLVIFTAFAALRRHHWWRWLTVVVRTLVAAEFLLAVGDRLGAFGPYGAPGVSWGDFARFVDYTRSITTFLPAAAAPTLAVLATVAETLLAVALLFGVRLRLAAVGAALLLGVYGTAMTISLPVAEQFYYSVFVLAAGMLALATVARPPLTVDAVLARFRQPSQPRVTPVAG